MKMVLNEIVISQIVSLYNDGYIRSEIAKQLDITEWLVRKSLCGKTRKQTKFLRLDSKDIFVLNSTYSNTNLRKRIIEEKLLEYTCSKCGLGCYWMAKPLTLQIDHINGISNDNRLENLRFLCPNCHSQTLTFGGRNCKNKKLKKERDCSCYEYCPKISFKQKKNPIWSVPLDKLRCVTESSTTFSEILDRISFPKKGAQYKALKERLYWEGISFSHIKCGKSHNLGSVFQRESIFLKSVMIKNSEYPNYLLKKRIFQEGFFEQKCIICGLENQWNNERLILQIHHINGISNDNRSENIAILCPNCHSQTDNYAGRNVQINR